MEHERKTADQKVKIVKLVTEKGLTVIAASKKSGVPAGTIVSVIS